MNDPIIAELHSAYCNATGFDLPLRMGRDRRDSTSRRLASPKTTSCS